MADAAVIGILVVSMGFVMWIGQRLARMLGDDAGRTEGGR